MQNAKFPVVPVIALSLAALGGGAIAAQDRSTLKSPDGLSFSEAKGYEAWQTIAVSQTETSLKDIVGNPATMRAYASGVPGGGKVFPDGSRIVKIEWSSKKNAESPYFVMIPDQLKSVAIMVKDSKKYAANKGWAWTKYDVDPATGELKSATTGTACGLSCHTAVAGKDYVFTARPPR